MCKLPVGIFKNEMKDKQNKDLETKQWTLIDKTPNTPQQTNGYDCGVFVSTFADYLSINLVLQCTQHEMPSIRQHMLESIRRGTLLNNNEY